MPLLYLPDGGLPPGAPTRAKFLGSGALFLWGEGVPPELQRVEPQAAARSTLLVTPAGRREVSGLELPLLPAVAALAVAPADAPERSASVAAWVLASKLALELVARERVVPVIQRQGAQLEARWA